MREGGWWKEMAPSISHFEQQRGMGLKETAPFVSLKIWERGLGIGGRRRPPPPHVSSEWGGWWCVRWEKPPSILLFEQERDCYGMIYLGVIFPFCLCNVPLHLDPSCTLPHPPNISQCLPMPSDYYIPLSASPLSFACPHLTSDHSHLLLLPFALYPLLFIVSIVYHCPLCLSLSHCTVAQKTVPMFTHFGMIDLL